MKENDQIDNKQPFGRLELISKKDFPEWDHLYEIVDYLNKSLKGHNLMFGLKKGEKETMSITIYQI